MGTPAAGTSKKGARCERVAWAGKEPGWHGDVNQDAAGERSNGQTTKNLCGEPKGFGLHHERYRKLLRILSRRVM